jgi:hypothetical protein
MENKHINFLPFSIDPAALRASFDLTRIRFSSSAGHQPDLERRSEAVREMRSTHQSADGNIRPRIFWLGGDHP